MLWVLEGWSRERLARPEWVDFYEATYPLDAIASTSGGAVIRAHLLIWSHGCKRWVWRLLPRQDWIHLKHVSWFAAGVGCSVGDWIALRAGADYVSASPFSSRVVDVPEPWSAALLGVALVGIAAVRGRRT